VRIIVDTNVLMSGVFFGGVPGRILDAWAEGRLELVLSPDILQEYRRVGAELAARYPERSGALAPALTLIAMNAILVSAATRATTSSLRRRTPQMYPSSSRAIGICSMFRGGGMSWCSHRASLSTDTRSTADSGQGAVSRPLIRRGARNCAARRASTVTPARRIHLLCATDNVLLKVQ